MYQVMQPMDSAATDLGEAQASLNPWQILRRHKLRVMLGLMTSLALVALYWALRGLEFESAAQLLVDKKGLDTAPISGPNPGQPAFDDYLATHQVVIASPRIINRAIRNGNLHSLESLRDQNDLTKAIMDGLSVTRNVPKIGATSPTRILNLSFHGKYPEDCRLVLKAVIDSYQDFLRDNYQNVNKETVDLIAKATKHLEEDLDKRVKAYQEFKKKIPVLAKTRGGNTVLEERLLAIDAKRSAYRMRAAEIEKTLADIDRALKNSSSGAELLALVAGMPSNRPLFAPGVVPNPPSLTDRERGNVPRDSRVSLEEELTYLRVQEARLLESYGPNNPEVKDIRTRIKTVKRMIAPLSQPGKAAELSEAERDLVNIKIQLLKGELNDVRTADKALAEIYEQDHKQAKEAILYQLEDDDHRAGIDRSQLFYDSIRQRLQQLESVRDYGGYTTQVLEEPGRGKWWIKKILLTLAVGLVLGLLWGGGWACLAEVADKSFRTPQEIRHRLDLPVMGHIPFTSRWALKKASAEVPALAEALRGVRTALFFSPHAQRRKVIQITSPDSGEGKTTLAAHLAASIAQSGKRVLLIDGDFRRPCLDKVYGLSNQAGLTSVLAGNADLASAIQQTRVAGLEVLPCGPSTRQPAEVLTSPRLKEILDLLRHQYDFVLIDTPPLLRVTDPGVVAPRVDGVLLVLRNAKSARPHAKRAREILEIVGAKVLGVVVNGVKRHGGVENYLYELDGVSY